MTDAPELLPCPFCGGKAEIWRASDRLNLPAWIACMGRCAVLISKEHKTTEEAVAAWNTRADLHEAQLAALRDRVEALNAEVARLTALVPRPEQTDDEILWRDYMRGTPYERLAKERGITRERMRHRLNDIARRLLALRGLEKP